MKTYNSVQKPYRQEKISKSSQKILGSKKYSKLQAKDFFHKVAQLSDKQKKALNYLIYMAQRVPCLFVSQSTIARYVGCVREWVCKNIVPMLTMLGLLVSKRQKYQYGFKPNVYMISPKFFKPEIIHELFPVLSSLRDLRKKFTLLSNEIDIKTISSTNSKIDNQKEERKTIDVMSWSIQDILNLRRC